MSVVRGCLAQVGCLSLVLGAAVVAWLLREPAGHAVQRWLGPPGPPAPVVIRVAPEVADSAEKKVGRLRGDSEVVWTLAEAQSWVTYRVEPALPDYVDDVRVTFLESALRLSARVEARRVPGADALGPIAELVGDTAEVDVVGRLDGVGAGRGVLFVDRVLVSGVPLPDPVRDRLLAPLRSSRDEGLPPHALAFPLPRPAWDVAVRDGQLVMRAAPAAPAAR